MSKDAATPATPANPANPGTATPPPANPEGLGTQVQTPPVVPQKIVTGQQDDPKATTPKPEPAAQTPPADQQTPARPQYYDDFNSGALDAAYDVLSSVDATQETIGKIFDKSVGSGDPADINLALLEKTVGKGQAALIMNAVNAEVAAAQAVVAEVSQAQHTIAGGEENWNNVVAWANTSFDAAGHAQINAAFEQGGMVAEAMIRHVCQQYTEKGRDVVENGALLSGQPGAGGQAQGITAIEYAQKFGELSNSNAGQAQFDQLNRARSLGKRQGI